MAFVLVSWRPDAPAGMERAVAAHAAGLVSIGHQAVIITACPDTPARYRGAAVATLTSLDRAFPCGDDVLRAAAGHAAADLTAEIARILGRSWAGVAIYADALWGLGRIMPRCPGTKNVLAAHVTGHDADLRPALSREPAAVIVPSAVVSREAAARGYDTSTWRIVPNALLSDPAPGDGQRREHLRSHGPVRVLARLGPEKGIGQLLGTSPQLSRPVQVALADAAFEGTGVTQRQLLDQCRALAAGHPGVTIEHARTWSQAPRWLGAAAIVIVPSLAETFGLVALEAMSQGTPVVARAVGNLPDLIGDGGVLVPARHGPAGLWRAARDLLADPVSYHRKSRAAYYLSRDYRPAHVASLLLKVVS